MRLLSGAYTLDVHVYDKGPVNGRIPPDTKLLASDPNLAFTMVRHKINSLNLTLTGAPKSLAVSELPSGTAGTAFTHPKGFSVIALDEAGYTIVGTYEHPLRLDDGDTSGATTIATTGSDDPPARTLLSSSDAATLDYTGLAIVPAAISASTAGAINGTGTFAPALQPIAIKTSDMLNDAYAGVDLYATSGTGSSATFSASEIGWTNAPYDKALSLAVQRICGRIATVSPAEGGSFAVTVASTPSAGTCTGSLHDGAGQARTVTLAYTNFGYTGTTRSIVVPAGVTKARIQAVGAQGGAGCCGGGDGGNGGSVAATVNLAPGRLSVSVGGQGAASAGTGGAGGFNGGAPGGTGSNSYGPSNGGGGGGGASTVLLDSAVLVVGGGGGGGGGG
ncbi:MAG TPA: hypothetical protein VMF61_05635, partial [Candidatus Acidoferrales bacterium]|nr:hypothetical protein [Candidatus Acidoferrales bacterium]